MISRMMRGLTLLAVLFLLPLAGWALGPHEILVLINTNSPDSVRIGGTYARLRKVPEANVIALGAPTTASISPAAFKESIFDPVLAESRRRGVASHILAWVYAPGFPWRIDGSPAMSITGLTFLRGIRPVANEWAVGQWLSPYFSGPHSPTERGFESRSLDMLSDWLGDERPMPGWALAHTGTRGLTLDDAGAMLVRGVDSDSTRPDGLFCFITNRDVRCQAREWQVRGAVEELTDMGFSCLVTNELPRGTRPLAGLLMGSVTFDTKGIRLSPGALVDNLTSFGAAFEVDSQTKCTDWLAAGAAATGGTVGEPYAYWTKFPNARLFVHAAAGCTALESFYQSIRQPLQYLPVGDPLAAPWKPKGEVQVEGLEETMGATNRYLRVSVKSEGTTIWTAFRFFIDGKEAGGGPLGADWPWNPSTCAPGPHEIRIVVRSAGLLRHQVFTVWPVTLLSKDAP
jgi:uncharacterized protein (TIGR03790 family)